MIFKIYDCDIGFKYNGTSYDLPNVDSLTVEDPEFNRIIRGADAKDKKGITYKEGAKEPKTFTTPFMGLTIDLKTLLDDIFKKQLRVDFYCISRVDGSAKMAKDAVLCQAPQQLEVNESPDSMVVSLMFQSFNSLENHKS